MAKAPRPRDPNRAQKIIDATLRVIQEKGVRAVTHRTVASEAAVPLGSTTYYFASIDELLIGALDHSVKEFNAWADPWFDERIGYDPIDVIVEFFVTDSANPDAIGSEYELYAAAFSMPLLRPSALAWSLAIERQFAKFVAPEIASAVGVLINGFFIRRYLEPESPRFTDDVVRENVRKVVYG